MLDDKEKLSLLMAMSRGMTMTYLSGGPKTVTAIPYKKEYRDAIAINACQVPSENGYYTMGNKYIYTLVKVTDSIVTYRLESIHYSIPDGIVEELGKNISAVCFIAMDEKIKYSRINFVSINKPE